MVTAFVDLLTPIKMRKYLPRRLRETIHLLEKRDVVRKKTADLAFMVTKQRGMREAMRKERDIMKENVNAAQTKLEEEQKKETTDGSVISNLTKYIERLTPDIQAMEGQMDAIDKQLEGQGGMKDGMDSLRSVQDLLTQHMKGI